MPAIFDLAFSSQFVFMAQGKDTMVRENSREEITVSDGLQLGRTTVDQTEIRSVEDEVESQHKEQNAEVSIHSFCGKILGGRWEGYDQRGGGGGTLRS